MNAQYNTEGKVVLITKDSTKLDSLVMVPGSLIIKKLNGEVVKESDYSVSYATSTLIWKGKLPISLKLTYRRFDFDWSFEKSLRDTSIIAERYIYKNPFRSDGSSTFQEEELIGLNSLTKSGSISRGVSVGNNQNLGVNSNFNLQLSGKITNDIEVLASITDDNIPIQPDGNTQQLQDFDQVFIQLFNQEKWKLIAGDYITNSNDGYFMRYNKKAKGLSFERNILLKDSTELSGKTDLAISRGKFATNRIQGVEGNQGPYKLIGAENELTIIVLSGTEQVFIDGKLLERGETKDYTIDYNSAEITFMAKQLITKNKRIVVQFQYADQNFIRSLVTARVDYKTNKWKSSFQYYSEQDHKNQPLQQELSDLEKQVLFNVGDQVDQAFVNREDTVFGEENSVLYEKRDSLGYQIYIQSDNEDTVRYRLRFSNVGTGNGNYVLNGFNAFGRVYRWVKPDTVSGIITRNGDYEPVTLLIAPKRKQLLTFDNRYDFSKNFSLNSTLALSANDINTFSDQGNQDNVGFGGQLGVSYVKPLRNKKWEVKNQTQVEFINENFSFIEIYRPIEFSRNWNLSNTVLNQNQTLGYTSFQLTKSKSFDLGYKLDVFLMDTVFQGIKNNLSFRSDTKPVLLDYQGSLLQTKSNINTNFYRHKSTAIKRFSFFQLGYEDEFEQNVFLINDSLLNTSYQFYDGKLFVQSGDSSSFVYKLYGGLRNEKTLQGSDLRTSIISNDYGLSYNYLTPNKRTKIFGQTAYRTIDVLDTTLNKLPNQTFVNQTDFSTSFIKRLIQLNTYYEIGSGLEQQREFLYIEVNPGQGTYAWIDYNDNGVKELNEFEIAQFQDQANYIRVFTQSNNYITAFSNKFSQSVRLDPKQLLGKSKSKGLRFLSKLSNTTNYKVDRKITDNRLIVVVNPISDDITDSSLLATTKQMRSTLFFNRTGYKYGLNYGVQQNTSKTLLVNGFDSRSQFYQFTNARYKWKKTLFNFDNQWGKKELYSDFTSNRNYSIDYLESTFKTTYQKEFNQFGNISYTYKKKDNTLGVEFAEIHNLGTEVSYALQNNINLTTRFNLVEINYVGEANTSVEYEMLEGLKNGRNYTWEVLLNKKIGKNLSLTINYNGRKPQGLKIIHAGTMELRAFF